MKIWNIDFCRRRKIFFSISLTLFAIMLVCAIIFGVRLDLQFKGGALITYSYDGDLDRGAFQKSVQELLGGTITMQDSTDVTTGAKNLIVSMPTVKGLDADRQIEIATALSESYQVNNLKTVSVNVVNPTIGTEFLQKSMVALGFAALVMVVYISLRFKKISGWSAGITAVIALLHDIIMVFAVFVLFRIPLNSNFIAVSLTILGYSLNDTIVIYDRLRENKRLCGPNLPTAELVNLSINQSFTRSLMTSITTISAMVVVTLVAMFYHVDSILSFSFPMIMGMISGFYSSVCIAPNLWVMWQDRCAQKSA